MSPAGRVLGEWLWRKPTQAVLETGPVHKQLQGALARELQVFERVMSDTLEGKIEKDGKTAAEFKLKSDVLLDEVRAGGRINLIIGRSLTAKAREFLGLAASTAFRLPTAPIETKAGLNYNGMEHPMPVAKQSHCLQCW